MNFCNTTLYQARHIPPLRATKATRFTLVWLGCWFDWRQALTIVPPETFVRWRRQGLRLLWRGPSQPGRPQIPPELQTLIRQMARDNCTWGQRRIANELRLKLGLQVSPRTIRKYMPKPLDRVPCHRVSAQRWRTFVRHHTRDLIINSMAANLTRGVQALSAQMIRVLQCWSGRSGVSAWQETVPRDAVSLARLIDTMAMPVVWYPNTREVLRIDERSPPAMVSPHTDGPCIAARVTPGDTFDVCPVVAARCWWHRASPHMPSAAPLSKNRRPATPWRRVA
jgi:Homeodomain-like domain